MQDSIEDKAMKRREQQAEHDRVSEIYRGRLESSSGDATDAATVHFGFAQSWLTVISSHSCTTLDISTQGDIIN